MDFQSFFTRTGMSQSDLDRAVGVSSAAVKKWREGGNMDLKYIDKLIQLGMRIFGSSKGKTLRIKKNFKLI